MNGKNMDIQLRKPNIKFIFERFIKNTWLDNHKLKMVQQTDEIIISLTEKAAERVKKLLEKENKLGYG